MSIFKCGCCLENFPDIHKNTHHKVPRSTGGKDTPDNLIDLCPGCHDALHGIAHKMVAKKYSPGQIIDSLKIIYKENQKAQQMCLTLAQFVRDSIIKTREEGLSQDHLVQCSTIIRKKHKDFLIIRCKELGISQEKYLRGLILQDLSTRFKSSQIRPEIEEHAIATSRKLIKEGLR